jgi:hypothetical protein
MRWPLGFQVPSSFEGCALRRSGYPACGLSGRTVQHDEVSNLPSKGRLLASVSLSLISVLNRLGGRSPVSLSLVPRDDNGKPRGLSGESVESSQRSAANDDTNRLSRRQLETALLVCGFRMFARHNRLIGSDRLLLCCPADPRFLPEATGPTRRLNTTSGR